MCAIVPNSSEPYKQTGNIYGTSDIFIRINGFML